MTTLIVLLHVLVCVFLIMVVLLQSGKAGDLASTFGGASTQTAFGARGATTLLAKLTTACAIIFMVTCLALSILWTGGSGSSVVDELQQEPPAATPANPPTAQTETPQQTPPPQQDNQPPQP